jgi:hypothetical protein
MLFGMGMTLSPAERKEVDSIVHPCFAALGLANDYFSFDREYTEFRESAKDMVKNATKWYEDEFLHLCEEYRTSHQPTPAKMDRYLEGLAHQVSGNVVWSLNCPRYHPSFRYNPNAGVDHVQAVDSSERLLGHLHRSGSNTPTVFAIDPLTSPA